MDPHAIPTSLPAPVPPVDGGAGGVPRFTPSMADVDNIVDMHSNRFRLVLEVYEPLIMVPGRGGGRKKVKVKGTGTYQKVKKGAVRFIARSGEEVKEIMEMVEALVNGRGDEDGGMDGASIRTEET